MIDTKRIAKLREFLAGVREEYELRGWRYCGEPEAVQDLLTLLEEAQIKAPPKPTVTLAELRYAIHRAALSCRESPESR